MLSQVRAVSLKFACGPRANSEVESCLPRLLWFPVAAERKSLGGPAPCLESSLQTPDLTLCSFLWLPSQAQKQGLLAALCHPGHLWQGDQTMVPRGKEWYLSPIGGLERPEKTHSQAQFRHGLGTKLPLPALLPATQARSCGPTHGLSPAITSSTSAEGSTWR